MAGHSCVRRGAAALLCLALSMKLAKVTATDFGGASCEQEGTCGDALGDDFVSPPSPPPPHARKQSGGRRTGGAKSVCESARAGLTTYLARDGFSQAKWQDDSDGRCWCLQAEPASNFRTWGKTRVVQLSNYNPARMHLWVEGDTKQLRSTMREDSDGILHYFTRFFPAMQSHSCSYFFAEPGTCMVRASPFKDLCIGIRAKPQHNSTLTVQHDYHRATLLPLAVAGLLFIVAPSAAHSLWCYYLTASTLMSVCCIGVLVFFALRSLCGRQVTLDPCSRVITQTYNFTLFVCCKFVLL